MTNLFQKTDRDSIMKQWDYWRRKLVEGNEGSAPRDWFEALLDYYEEKQAVCSVCGSGGDFSEPAVEHELKTWPEFFEDIWNGVKTFVLRKDDRGFCAGDRLRLREWSKSGYTGREIVATATYILSDVVWIERGWVIIAIRPLTA